MALPYLPSYLGQQYVNYSDEAEVNDLDRNIWRVTKKDIRAGVTGRHLYKGEPRHSAYYTCFSGRDPETHYIIGRERETHPDHSSRFGYARCRNGYCAGHRPGFFNENDHCSEVEMPKDMSPERFYKYQQQCPASSYSQANADYELMKILH